VQRLLVVVTLRPGAAGAAADLIAEGPPFDLAAHGLGRHGVYLSEREVVFTFEGRSIERLLSAIVNDPVHGGAFARWAPLTVGSPRLVLERFHWSAAGEPESEEPPLGTVLVATDGSAASDAAVEAGVDLAAETGARAVFVFAVDPLDRAYGRFGEMPLPPLALPAAEDVSALVSAAERARGRGVECRTRVVAGIPADAILVVADELAADLIVVGSRGAGPIGRALMGSVSTALVHRSRRPVLVVHAPRGRAREEAAA
jgi:nucleotide-binding universal stress UspA family protein